MLNEVHNEIDALREELQRTRAELEKFKTSYQAQKEVVQRAIDLVNMVCSSAGLSTQTLSSLVETADQLKSFAIASEETHDSENKPSGVSWSQ